MFYPLTFISWLARKLFMTLHMHAAQHQETGEVMLHFSNNFAKMSRNAVFPHVHTVNHMLELGKEAYLKYCLVYYYYTLLNFAISKMMN